MRSVGYLSYEFLNPFLFFVLSSKKYNSETILFSRSKRTHERRTVRISKEPIDCKRANCLIIHKSEIQEVFLKDSTSLLSCLNLRRFYLTPLELQHSSQHFQTLNQRKYMLFFIQNLMQTELSEFSQEKRSIKRGGSAEYKPVSARHHQLQEI
jgi:hypothetical protein